MRVYQWRTLAADALIASTYLAGTNTRRVRRALGALFGGTVGKDTVSRTWRKVKSGWDAWNTRALAGFYSAVGFDARDRCRGQELAIGVQDE